MAVNSRPFRFYDNRQKYLAFVNTCDEKWKVAERAAQELQYLQPTPPAFRLFDAGMGDGTLLAHLMRAMHRRYPTIPFYVVAKEISLEDIRLSLEKMPDRFVEHPASVIILTNLYYAESPWLMPKNVEKAAALNWLEVSLEGDTAHGFGEQLRALDDDLVHENPTAPGLLLRRSHHAEPESPVELQCRPVVRPNVRKQFLVPQPLGLLQRGRRQPRANAAAPLGEFDERGNDAHVVERVRVRGKRLQRLKPDRPRLTTIHRHVEHAAPWEVANEVPLRLYCEWRIEHGVRARLNNWVQNADNRLRVA